MNTERRQAAPSPDPVEGERLIDYCESCGWGFDVPGFIPRCPNCDVLTPMRAEALVPATLFTEVGAELEAARGRFAAIQQGKPYPDCHGDCGENGLYCCDGAWDQWRRRDVAEARAEHYKGALMEIETAVRRYRNNHIGEVEMVRLIREALNPPASPSDSTCSTCGSDNPRVCRKNRGHHMHCWPTCCPDPFHHPEPTPLGKSPSTPNAQASAVGPPNPEDGTPER